MQNLVRYRPAGTYFARFRVNGKRVWKSLETTVFSVAKQQLSETIREHRAKLESVAAVTIGKMTVGDAARVYLEKVHANVSLKPRSKDYREGLIDFINRSWPALFGTDVRKVSERDCQEWLVRFQKLYAPSVVNNGIGTLRREKVMLRWVVVEENESFSIWLSCFAVFVFISISFLFFAHFMFA